MRLERADEIVVARPTLVLVKEDKEQRRCVGAPVVRGVRTLSTRGELAKAQLVQDLARLLFMEVVAHLGLAGGEHAQRGGGQLWQVWQAPGSS